MGKNTEYLSMILLIGGRNKKVHGGFYVVRGDKGHIEPLQTLMNTSVVGCRFVRFVVLITSLYI